MPYINKTKTCVRAFSWEMSSGDKEKILHALKKKNQVTYKKKNKKKREEKKNRNQMALDFSAAILEAR